MSTFYKNLPTIPYQLNPPKSTGETTKKTNIPNVFLGVSLADRYKENSVYYTLYTVADGETPNSISMKLYGTEEYGWLIMMMNDIYDMNSQWPLTDQQLDQYINTKYRMNNNSRILYLDTVIDSVAPGSLVYLSGASSATAYVWDWNPTYKRLILTDWTLSLVKQDYLIPGILTALDSVSPLFLSLDGYASSFAGSSWSGYLNISVDDGVSWHKVPSSDSFMMDDSGHYVFVAVTDALGHAFVSGNTYLFQAVVTDPDGNIGTSPSCSVTIS